MYVWGKSKGHEKSSFEYGAKLQQMEIDNLKAQLAQMQKQIQLTTNNDLEPEQ